MGKTGGALISFLGVVRIVHGSEGTKLVVEAEFDLRPEHPDEKRAVWRFFSSLHSSVAVASSGSSLPQYSTKNPMAACRS